MQETLSVPNEVAVELAGIGDGVLASMRDRLGCTIHLRGNRLTIEGDEEHVDQARTVIDEIVVSTHPETRSGWLRQGLVDRLARATRRHVEHVVVDESSRAIANVLVVANETVLGEPLLERIRVRAREAAARIEAGGGNDLLDRLAGEEGFTGLPPGAWARARDPAAYVGLTVLGGIVVISWYFALGPVRKRSSAMVLVESPGNATSRRP